MLGSIQPAVQNIPPSAGTASVFSSNSTLPLSIGTRMGKGTLSSGRRFGSRA